MPFWKPEPLKGGWGQQQQQPGGRPCWEWGPWLTAVFFNPGTERIFQQDVVSRAPPHWQDSPPLYREAAKAARTRTVPAGGCTGSRLSNSLSAPLIGRLWVPRGPGIPAGDGAGGWPHFGMEQFGKLTVMLLCKHIQWINLQVAYELEIGTDLSDTLKCFILSCVLPIGFHLKYMRDHARLKARTGVLGCSLVTSNTAIAESSLTDAACRAGVMPPSQQQRSPQGAVCCWMAAGTHRN